MYTVLKVADCECKCTFTLKTSVSWAAKGHTIQHIRLLLSLQEVSYKRKNLITFTRGCHHLGLLLFPPPNSLLALTYLLRMLWGRRRYCEGIQSGWKIYTYCSYSLLSTRFYVISHFLALWLIEIGVQFAICMQWWTRDDASPVISNLCALYTKNQNRIGGMRIRIPHFFVNKTHNDYIICVCFHVNRAVLFPHMIYYSTKYFRKL